MVYRACSGESLLSSTIDCKGTAVSGKGVRALLDALGEWKL